LEAPAARLLTRLGFSPNGTTLAGLVIAGASAYLLSVGQLAAGGGALLLSGIFDLFDGAVGRPTGRVTRFGGLLDSVVDRLSEAAVLLGLLVFYVNHASTATSRWGTVLVYAALAGSFMVSYARARAEGLGVDCKVGVMTRPERIALLGVALIVGQWWLPAVAIVLGTIAILTLVTTVQRVLHVRRELERKESGQPPPRQDG
jgi:CDP-diacylglycerol--glycerol-3-phosphate 3-phosphatidyltransferase